MIQSIDYDYFVNQFVKVIEAQGEDFEFDYRGLHFIFSCDYHELWSEVYAAVEFMGDEEMTADYLGVSIDDLVFNGAYNEDGEEVPVDVDINYLLTQIESRLEP